MKSNAHVRQGHGTKIQMCAHIKRVKRHAKRRRHKEEWGITETYRYIFQISEI